MLLHHNEGLLCVNFAKASNDSVFVWADDVPTGGSDADIQLLEASKAGDMDLIKVNIWLLCNDQYMIIRRLNIIFQEYQ